MPKIHNKTNMAIATVKVHNEHAWNSGTLLRRHCIALHYIERLVLEFMLELELECARVSVLCYVMLC